MDIHIVAWNMGIGALSASVIRPPSKQAIERCAPFPPEKIHERKQGPRKDFGIEKKAFVGELPDEI